MYDNLPTEDLWVLMNDCMRQAAIQGECLQTAHKLYAEARGRWPDIHTEQLEVSIQSAIRIEQTLTEIMSKLRVLHHIIEKRN